MTARRLSGEERDFFRDNFGDSDSDSDFHGFSTDDGSNYSPENSDSDESSASEAAEEDHARRDPDPSLWSRIISEQTIVNFTLDHGPKLPRDLDVAEASPLKYFRLFFSDSMYEKIAAETNAYAALCARESSQADRHWTPTDGEEMKAFLVHQYSWV